MRLIEYLPYILRPIKDFQALTDAEQPEFEAANAALDDVYNEFLLDHMSAEATAEWEGVLRLEHDPADTLETRRAAVKALVSATLPITYRTLLHYLLQIAPGSTVDLRHNDYEIDIKMPDNVSTLRRAIQRALRAMIPANLIIRYIYELWARADIYVGAMAIGYDKVVAQLPPAPEARAPVYAGGAAATYQRDYARRGDA